MIFEIGSATVITAAQIIKFVYVTSENWYNLMHHVIPQLILQDIHR